ncbi:hypothetical protein [Cellulophaga baltica]|uniref:hypothetical protein n=1 Tax=Cellulophaga baltica TaxID=76594 RepID=UPI00041DC812|nr:hypothetical protein [Cellulophaga baltica]AIY12553.1 hypothetical protein M667_04685 [Cellulophaga baltica NN016038]
MVIYIEKEFLDNFYLDYNENCNSKLILATIFSTYGDVKYFIDIPINSADELEHLKSENIYFACLSQYLPPISVNSIKDHFFSRDKNDQVIIFTNESKEWHLQAEKKGALCFSFLNYVEKIKAIQEKVNKKIDLSQPFSGWEFINSFDCLPVNRITLNDGYVLTDKSGAKIRNNLFSIIKALLENRDLDVVDFKIFTKDLNPLRPGTPDQIIKASKERLALLNSYFARYKMKVQIVNNSLKSEFDFHDRFLLSNYFFIDCPRGFNLMPYKVSNSQIITQTIFDKYSYNRLKNLNKMHCDYLASLENLETLSFKQT